MRRAWYFAAACIVAGAIPARAAEPAQSVGLPSDARAVVDKYCVTCHNDRTKVAGLTLQSVDLDNVPGAADRLEKVVRKLRAGTMPPIGNPRPDATTYVGLQHWLEQRLDDAALRQPNPGRTESVHRLNRAEYQNAIRDLLDLEGLDFTTLLPADDASYGFDNIAGVLGMSPTHLEQYLRAARFVSRTALGDVTLAPSGEHQVLPPDLSQDDRLEELPFGTRGGVLLRRYFPVDAEYVIRIQAVSGVWLSEEEPNFIEVTIDGARVFYEKMKQKPVRHLVGGADGQSSTDWEVRVPIKAGFRRLAVTFLQTTNGQLEDLLQPFLRPPGISTFRLMRVGGNSGPYVAQVSFAGPFNTSGPGDTPSRRRILSCRPTSAADEQSCARKILTQLARRAYRRPVTKVDVDALMIFFDKGRGQGTFESGVQVALERLLASPDFLFRLEEDPARATPGQPYRISDLALASRLSFFLWSSIPDDQLLDVASSGQLSTPKILESQVRRMLADSKSNALVTNFAGQWLRLRNLPGLDRNARIFPDFDDNLRLAMRRESELLFTSVVREDRSVLDFLNADYTFVNERLARHYGIPNIYGSHFRRVPVTDPSRRGLLGHASVLSVTSQSNRTSPVTRGKWILENLLGAPPPAPPDNIPALEATKLEGTLRQRMEQHRKNPVCASCHGVMDPLGFALEHYDPVGQLRDTDDGYAIDATGSMPDGAKFDGAAGLRAALLAKSDVFVETLAERMMIFALGRGMEYYDASAIRQIARTTKQDDYRFSRVVLGIVGSAPFQMRMPAPDAPLAVSRAARR